MTFKVCFCFSPANWILRAEHAVQEALHEVSHRLFLQVLFPDWLLRNGTSKMRYFYRAYGELGVCYAYIC